MMLLGILKGYVVLTSAAALVILAAALVEERVVRSTRLRTDYLAAIVILRRLIWLALPVCLIMTVNYAYRFRTGLPGSILPGPEANSVFSMASLGAAYTFMVLLGATLFWALRQADLGPSEEELAQRRTVTRRRIAAERRRRERS